MIARSPWSLLLFVIQQPNAAALAHSRVSRKLSGSGTSVAAPVATARVHNGGWLQQLRPGVTPWVNDDIYQAKLESQTRIAEATQEDSYALITALSLAAESVGPLALAVALAVVGLLGEVRRADDALVLRPRADVLVAARRVEFVCELAAVVRSDVVDERPARNERETWTAIDATATPLKS